ncbi:MAG: diguanylate cyclase [Enterocloster bolteae]
MRKDRWKGRNGTGTGHAVTFSIGVSFYPDHGRDFSSLYEKADAAMYHAKRRGKNQYYIYKEDAPEA